MKKTRIIQRTVSAFLAAAMLATLASCNVNLPGSRNTSEISNQPRKIMNYYTTEMLSVPENFGYAENLFCNGENIFVYGSKSNDEAVTLAGIYDFGTKELNDIDLSALNADGVYSATYLGNNLVLSYTGSESESYSQKLAILDTVTSEVKCSVDFGGNCYVSGVTTNADGDIVAVVEEWGGLAQKYTVKTFESATLKEKSSIDITESLSIGNDTYLSGVVFDDAGDIYSLLMEYGQKNDEMYCKLIKFKADGTVVYVNDELTDLNGGGMVIKRTNGNICVMSSYDGINFAFDEIDNETGAVKERYDVILDQEIHGICMNCGTDTDLIYGDASGIWKLNIETEKPEKILSYGKELPDSYTDNISQMAYIDGKMFLYGQDWGGNQSQIYKFDNEGTFVEAIPVKDISNGGYVMSVEADAEGNIYAISQEDKYREDGTEESSCFITEIKEDGTLGNRTEFKIDTDDNYYIEKIEKTSSGDYAAVVYNYGGEDSKTFVVIFDASGNSKAKLEDKDIVGVNGYYSTPNCDYLYYRTENGTSVMRKVDNAAYQLGETVECNIPEDIQPMKSDGKYDMCYSTSSGIYGFSFAENKSTEILNYIDSDIVFSVWNSSFLGDDRIVCQGYDYSNGEQQMYILKRADDETLKKIQNKQLMTIACVGLEYNSEFREKVVDYNRNSNDYRLQVNDYNRFSKYEDDTYISGAFQLNNDMAAGNVPDILIGTDEVSMTSFAAKNVLADLAPYFDNDAEIKREDFFENILNLGSYKGKLCQVFAGYSIGGLAGPESKLGKETTLTHEDLMALKKNGPVFYEKTSRETIIKALIKGNLAEYVDFENKKCDFDNDRFAGLIDLVKEEGSDTPEMETYAEYKEGDELSEASRFKDKKCQLDILNTYNFFPLLELQQGALGEAAVIKGYPSESGSGIIISPNMTFAVCEKSKNKDAAWDFIRTFLTEDYQDAMNDNYIRNFPVRKDSFDDLLVRGKNPEDYQYSSVTKPDGSYVDMKPLDDTTAEKIRKAVECADRCVLSDERIEKIIDEALDQVFNGEKTSSDAAAEIQSKVSTYLNEIK